MLKLVGLDELTNARALTGICTGDQAFIRALARLF